MASAEQAGRSVGKFVFGHVLVTAKMLIGLLNSSLHISVRHLNFIRAAAHIQIFLTLIRHSKLTVISVFAQVLRKCLKMKRFQRNGQARLKVLNSTQVRKYLIRLRTAREYKPILKKHI